LQATSKAQQKATGKHPLVEASASENVLLGNELAEVTRKSQQSEELSLRVAYQTRLIQQGLARLSRQLEFEGLGDALGDVLLSRRAELAESIKLLEGGEQVKAKLTQVRLAQFRVSDEQLRLQPEGGLVSFSNRLRPEAMSEASWLNLKVDLQPLHKDRMRLLEQLLEAYAQSEKQLTDLSLGYQELDTQCQSVIHRYLYAD